MLELGGKNATVVLPSADLDAAAEGVMRSGFSLQNQKCSATSRVYVHRDVLPAFVDPHVHLRTPGQEHKEDLETGTRAAAAGGYAGVLAMPNTDPVLDSAPLLRSVRELGTRLRSGLEQLPGAAA